MSVENSMDRETRAFNAQLPEMLGEHEGQFAVFRDESPAGFFSDVAEAYSFAVQHFGPDGKFLIEQVARRGREIASLSWELGVVHVGP